jgi:hypothetical protein
MAYEFTRSFHSGLAWGLRRKLVKQLLKIKQLREKTAGKKEL